MIMSVAQEIHGKKLEQIQFQIDEIDRKLESYLENYNVKQLQHDLDLSNTNHEKGTLSSKKTNGFGELNRNDQSEVIEVCNQLSIINELITEFQQQNQFEHKSSVFIKLRSKINNLHKSISSTCDADNIKILKELKNKLHSFKNDVTNMSKEKIHEYLYINEELEISFNKVNSDGLPYEKFLSSSKDLLDTSLNEVFELNKMFNDWIIKVFDKLDKGYKVVIENDQGSFKLSFLEQEVEIIHFANSIEKIILFFNEIALFSQNIKDFGNYRSLTGKNILTKLKSKIFQKENVYPLIIDKINYDEYGNGKDSKVSVIARLYEISRLLSEKYWSKDGFCELEFWIDDLTNSWVNNLVEVNIDNIKEYVMNLLDDQYNDLLKNENLITKALEFDDDVAAVQTKQPEQLTQNEDWNNEDWNENWGSDGENKVETKVQVKKENTDTKSDEWNDEDDGWNDDAWGSDEEVDAQIQAPPVQKEEDEDGWDAWGGEDDLKSLKSNASIKQNFVKTDKKNQYNAPVYKYSKLVMEAMKIFDTYMKNYDDLKNLHVGNEQIMETHNLFKHGFKKLCISYYMMLSSKIKSTYKNKILFYNDYNKILEECYTKYTIDLTSCFKMNSSFIEKFTNSYTTLILNVIDDYRETIWEDNDLDNDDNLNTYKMEFLIRYDSQFNEIKAELNNSFEMNTQMILDTFVTVVFNSFNTICDLILSRKDISSYESEVLSDIIDDITNPAAQQITIGYSNINLENIQTFNKLRQVRLVLSNNLKSILDIFYDARLHEIETDELISLIKSLFVESPQRENTIAEIRTARETQF